MSKQMTITVPRLKKGQGMKGPEPFGCFNTGVAPVILRSIATGKYLVGADLEVDSAREKILFGNYAKVRIIKHPTIKQRNVYVYKTRGPAVAKFIELCQRQFDENESMRADYKQAAKDAKSTNPDTRLKGMLKMADY